MSYFLTNLILNSRGQLPVVRPRPQTLFEPRRSFVAAPGFASGLIEEVNELPESPSVLPRHAQLSSAAQQTATADMHSRPAQRTSPLTTDTEVQPTESPPERLRTQPAAAIGEASAESPPSETRHHKAHSALVPTSPSTVEREPLTSPGTAPDDQRLVAKQGKVESTGPAQRVAATPTTDTAPAGVLAASKSQARLRKTSSVIDHASIIATPSTDMTEATAEESPSLPPDQSQWAQRPPLGAMAATPHLRFTRLLDASEQTRGNAQISSPAPLPGEVRPRHEFSAGQSIAPPEQTAADRAPVIRVTIGRIEVRAIQQAAPSTARPPARLQDNRMSLETYLKQQKGAR